MIKTNYKLNDNGLNVSIGDAKRLLADGMQKRSKQAKNSAIFGAYCILSTIQNLINLSFESDERSDT